MFAASVGEVWEAIPKVERMRQWFFDNIPAFEPAIRGFFPYARVRPVAGAGHWVYSEQPGAFSDALRRFLSRELA